MIIWQQALVPLTTSWFESKFMHLHSFGFIFLSMNCNLHSEYFNGPTNTHSLNNTLFHFCWILLWQLMCPLVIELWVKHPLLWMLNWKCYSNHFYFCLLLFKDNISGCCIDFQDSWELPENRSNNHRRHNCKGHFLTIQINSQCYMLVIQMVA